MMSIKNMYKVLLDEKQWTTNSAGKYINTKFAKLTDINLSLLRKSESIPNSDIRLNVFLLKQYYEHSYLYNMARILFQA
jgi:hypothetical protein